MEKLRPKEKRSKNEDKKLQMIMDEYSKIMYEREIMFKRMHEKENIKKEPNKVHSITIGNRKKVDKMKKKGFVKKWRQR